MKDCHILNIDINGRLKEPNLDSTGNYIIRAQWLADKNQALLTADFIKIYDLSTDSISPFYSANRYVVRKKGGTLLIKNKIMISMKFAF